MQIVQESKPSLWKNQRIIDSHGLVECEPRQRLFNNIECGTLLEDLLKIYQQKGLKLHYVQYGLKKVEENQTITYKCYVEYRCPAKDKQQPKKRMIGEFFVHYKIMRISPQTILCKYPYLLLFELSCGEEYCGQCDEHHLYKITQSSFYVIRTQFIYELIRKITFMNKYPTYNFTPHNFVSKESTGETVYQYVKDHNYQPSYYYERSQSSLASLLKMQMIRRQMDCQTVRLQLLCEGNMQAVQKHRKKMFKHTSFLKLKYMCRKCQGKEIWTTKDTVALYYGVYGLEENFQHRLNTLKPEDQNFIFEGSQIQSKYVEQNKKDIANQTTNPEQKISIKNLFKIQDRRLDRSIQRQYKEFEEFQKDMTGCYAFHKELQKYKSPFLVVFSIKIPKMSCARCNKEKDGLIYITNLVDESHVLNRKIIAKIRQIAQKKNPTVSKEA